MTPTLTLHLHVTARERSLKIGLAVAPPLVHAFGTYLASPRPLTSWLDGPGGTEGALGR